MSDTEAKNKPASKRKLAKQREDGVVAQSNDLAALMASFFVLALMMGAFPLALIGTIGNFSTAAAVIDMPFKEAARIVVTQVGMQIVTLLVPISVAALGSSIIITIIYNKGIPFAIKPIVPKFDRMSPASGFKRIYGMRGWVETAQTFVRAAIWVASAGVVLWLALPQIFSLGLCGASCLVELSVDLLLIFIPIAMILLVISGVFDMLIQRFLFQNEQKMSHSEVKRENKEQVGSPEIRQERKRRQREDSKGGEAIGVDKANMCFFWKNACVAIRYHPKYAPLPRISGKATTADAVQSMRERVRRNGFPEMEHKLITETSINTPNGDGVSEKIYVDLAQAMRNLFAGAAG